MDRREKAAVAILAARGGSIPYMLVCRDCTDAEVEAKRKQAQIEHPLQEIRVIRVIHE